MRRILLIGGILALLIATVVISAPFILSTETVRSKIVAHLNELTGRNVTFRGSPEISISPFMGIEISDLSVPDLTTPDSATPLLTAEKLSGKLNVLSALFGDVEIEDYKLHRPALMLRKQTDGQANWHFGAGGLKDAYDASKATLGENGNEAKFKTDLGSFEIVDGRISFENAINGTEENVSNINGQLIWPDTSSGFEIRGSGIWRNENTKFEVNADKPMFLMSGGTSDLQVSFSSEPLKYTFQGEANLLADLFVKGEIEASSPSLSRLSNFLKLNLGQTNIIGEWTASGNIDATAQTTLLTNAIIGLDGNQATGVVRLARNEADILNLDGSLAFEQIDASSFLKTDAKEAAEVINPNTLRDLNADMRMSAKSLVLGAVSLENVAATISLSKEEWKIDIGDAKGFDGTIAANFTSKRDPNDAQLSLKLTAKDANLEQVFSLLDDSKLNISGKGNLDADLRTKTSLADLANMQINGTVSMTVDAGTLSGVDLGKLQDADAGTGVDKNYTGETDFEKLTLKAFLSRNKATISKASISTGEDKAFHVIGDIGLKRGSLALRAQRMSEDGPDPQRLVIGGTLRNPLIASSKLKENPKPTATEADQQPEPNNNDADG